MTSAASPAPVPPDDPFGALATQIEERPQQQIEEAPQTANSRYLYWIVGGLCALTIGLAEVGILLRSDVASQAPPAPPEVLQTMQNDACAIQMARLMDGVAAYTAKHGAPPQSLAALYPDFIAFQPIDPAVNQPYGYEVVGESVSITCPSAAVAGAPPA
ncbi:MAG: hypothetical protein SF182_10275 [Deltaproteobacteria bacterium]|nr:hypothetical protein [Deltaproteobacteria bacterium]